MRQRTIYAITALTVALGILAACNSSAPAPTPPAPPASIDEPLDCDQNRRDDNGRPIPNC